MTTDMELDFIDKSNLRNTDLREGEFYVCNHEESWYRVQLINWQG